MLDIKRIREERDWVEAGLKSRNSHQDIDKLLSLDSERVLLVKDSETLKFERNSTSEKIGILRKKGEPAEAETARMRDVSKRIKELDNQVKDLAGQIRELALFIPNIPDASVPLGKSEEDNVEVRKWGEIPNFSFTPLSHQDIGEKLGILDFERGAKIAGSGFTAAKKGGAGLVRALINFMIDLHTREHNYVEISPPFLANRESLLTTGNLPKFEDDLYKIESDGLYLIPTAEVPVTNIHRSEILDEKDMPYKYVSYTPCFRREAGSWGQETKGLIRQHQFDKVELVQFATPETSAQEHEALVANAEEVLKRLELPFRTVVLCSGDMGFSSAKTYDIEVWLPSHKRYREISSCSCFTDFQARRGSIRYRAKEGGKPRHVHTLNGSALAVGRTLVAILENYQNEKGCVTIPSVLRPYMGGLDEISAF